MTTSRLRRRVRHIKKTGKSSKRVALVMDVNNEHARSMVRGILGFLHQFTSPPFTLEWATGAPAPDFARWDGDGIIVQGRNLEILDVVKQPGVPVVNVSAFLENPGVPSVMTDNFMVGQFAARHLLNRGFEHFGSYMVQQVGLSIDRAAGFKNEITKAHRSCDERFVSRLQLSRDSRLGDLSEMIAWLKTLPRPVGLFAVNDQSAKVLVHALGLCGMQIPDDVAIIGADNEEFLCETNTPTLSSVDTGVHRVGRQAAALLHRLMNGARAPARIIRVPPVGVVARQSTDILAVSDQDVATALRFIYDHGDTPINVGDILANVPANRRTLERKFQQTLGRSPHDEIVRVRIERAKRLLANTDWTMTNVAYASGFRYVAQMMTTFKKQLKMSPGEFRNDRLGHN